MLYSILKKSVYINRGISDTGKISKATMYTYRIELVIEARRKEKFFTKRGKV